MKSISNDILELLKDDILSHGILAQFLEQASEMAQREPVNEEEILTELLVSKKVEIGATQLSAPDYVKFVAWTGTVDERVRRAAEAVANAVGHEKEFAFWLCLANNIDCFEQQEN